MMEMFVVQEKQQQQKQAEKQVQQFEERSLRAMPKILCGIEDSRMIVQKVFSENRPNRRMCVTQTFSANC